MIEIFNRLKSKPNLFVQILIASLFVNLFALATPIYVIQVLQRYVAYGVTSTLITLIAGIIFISQIEDSTLIPFKYIPGYSKSGIPAIHLANEVADDILRSVGSSREIIQNKMNRSLKSESFTIPSSLIS